MGSGLGHVLRRGWRRPLAAVSFPVALAASAALALGAALPASATIAGPTGDTGIASLPSYPCPTTCTGTFSATGGGVAEGKDNSGKTYVGAGAGKMTATYSYHEPCGALTGTASGSLTVAGLHVRDGSQLVTGTLNGSFSWTRVGLTAIITVSGTSLTFSNGNTASGAGNGSASSVFVPLLGVSNTKCPGGPLKAVVIGAAAEAK